MLISVDPSSPTPIFEQIARHIRAEVAYGRLTEGQRLPSGKALAESLALNVHTVLHAYQLLRDEGLLELRRGRGAVVSASARPLQELRAELTALKDKAQRLGLAPESLAALLAEGRS